MPPGAASGRRRSALASDSIYDAGVVVRDVDRPIESFGDVDGATDQAVRPAKAIEKRPLLDASVRREMQRNNFVAIWHATIP